ncbi:Uncharacterised protein [Mycobacteroides abscessus]|nr:Uncharacterised protein [Mycobacteroides abscessus]
MKSRSCRRTWTFSTSGTSWRFSPGLSVASEMTRVPQPKIRSIGPFS